MTKENKDLKIQMENLKQELIEMRSLFDTLQNNFIDFLVSNDK